MNWERRASFAEGIPKELEAFLAGNASHQAEAFKAYSEVLGLNWRKLSHAVPFKTGEKPQSLAFSMGVQRTGYARAVILKDRCHLLLVGGRIGKRFNGTVGRSIQEHSVLMG
jgi:hypothetical protein